MSESSFERTGDDDPTEVLGPESTFAFDGDFVEVFDELDEDDSPGPEVSEPELDD